PPHNADMPGPTAESRAALLSLLQPGALRTPTRTLHLPRGRTTHRTPTRVTAPSAGLALTMTTRRATTPSLRHPCSTCPSPTANPHLPRLLSPPPANTGPTAPPASPLDRYPARRASLSPDRAYSYPTSSSHRRPVSPEPLYSEYREYRDNQIHYREREREREREVRDRERDIYRERESRIERREKRMITRSSQTSPVRVEPVHPTVPRTYLRMLTPSQFRHRLGGGSDPELSPPHNPMPLSDSERKRLREECEEHEREREREKQHEIQRVKYQYESRMTTTIAQCSVHHHRAPAQASLCLTSPTAAQTPTVALCRMRTI
ncbi:hypothetical protein H0H87_007334, partial [Tephrocybe sp. NHM501043]